jgi:hypothetical protein
MLILLISATLVALVLNTAVAQAQPAPPGYRSDEVLRSVTTATNKVAPIRRGWYSVTDQTGFGYNKACQRHNVCNLDAISYVLRSPVVVPKRNEPGFNYIAYAQQTINRKVTNEVKVIAADNPGSFPVYYGSPGGNPLGLQAVYCETVPKGEPVLDLKCPNWVNEALARQGRAGV